MVCAHPQTCIAFRVDRIGAHRVHLHPRHPISSVDCMYYILYVVLPGQCFFRPLCFFVVIVPSSKKPPNSSALRAAWLMCLNLSGPKRVPPQNRVTATRTLLQS